MNACRKTTLEVHFIYLGIISFIFHKMLHNFLFSYLNNTFCINCAQKFKYRHWLTEGSLKYFTILRKIIVQWYVSSFVCVCVCVCVTSWLLMQLCNNPLDPYLLSFWSLSFMWHRTYLTWKKKIIIYKTKDKPKLNLVTRLSRFVCLIFGTEIKIIWQVGKLQSLTIKIKINFWCCILHSCI